MMRFSLKSRSFQPGRAVRREAVRYIVAECASLLKLQRLSRGNRRTLAGFVAGRLAGEFATVKNAASSEKRFLYDAGEAIAEIGRNAVAVVQGFWRDSEFRFRIEDAKIGVVAGSELPFPLA